MNHRLSRINEKLWKAGVLASLQPVKWYVRRTLRELFEAVAPIKKPLTKVFNEENNV